MRLTFCPVFVDHYTSAIYSKNIFEKLLSKGLDINGINSPSYPIYTTIPLLAAIYEDDVELVKWIMDKGANLSSIGELCFCVAYDNKNTEIMDMLVANGVNPDIKNKVYINQQLYTLIRSESIKTKKILAILNSCACYNHSEITKILIERGANIDHVNKQDRTPILQALIYNSNETAKILVENGANISGIIGVDYLNTAIANKNKINVDLLINAGVDINDSTESTPLQTAVNQSHVPIIKKLLEKGANPNLKTEKENYPLAIAIKKGHEFITHLLLLHGADANLPFDKKSSIKDLAAKSKNQAIASMVQLDKEELKKIKPRQKLLRFTNKRMLFAEGVDNWTDAIKTQIEFNFGKIRLEDIQIDTGEIEYFDVVDESGKDIYQLMLFNYGSGSLFNFGKKSVVGNIIQHGFHIEKPMTEDAASELRTMLDDAYRGFEGEIRQIVEFLEN